PCLARRGDRRRCPQGDRRHLRLEPSVRDPGTVAAAAEPERRRPHGGRPGSGRDEGEGGGAVLAPVAAGSGPGDATGGPAGAGPARGPYGGAKDAAAVP